MKFIYNKYLFFIVDQSQKYLADENSKFYLKNYTVLWKCF